MLKQQLTAFYSGCLGLLLVTSVSPAEVTVKDIAGAFQRRQEQVRSARFTWTERRTYPKGSIISPDTGEAFPLKETTIQRTVTVSLEGAKINYTCDGQVWSFDRREFITQKRVSTSDGHSSKDLLRLGKDDVSGAIHDRNEVAELHSVELEPILLSYRALHSMYEPHCFLPENWSVSAARERINGVDCLVLKRVPKPDRVEYLALAPQLGFSLVRHSHLRKGIPTLQVDVTQIRRDQDICVPTAWKVTRMNNRGVLDWLISASDMRFELNQPIEPGVFDIQFPVGAVVYDEREKRQHVVLDDGGEKPVIRLKDGTLVPIAASERAVRVWLIAAAVTGSVIVIVLLLWIRRTTTARGG